MEEEKCGAFLVWFKKAVSDKYEKIKEVTKGNVNECRVSEVKRCANERKRWYNKKHYRDASFDSVHDSRILACPTTHTSNSMYW